jgi:hypothetical protein
MVQQSPRAESTSGAGGGSNGSRLSGGAAATIGGGGLLLLFMLQNRQDVTLQFLVWSFTWPLWLLTLVSAVFGSILWIGIGILRRHRRRVARRDARGG